MFDQQCEVVAERVDPRIRFDSGNLLGHDNKIHRTIWVHVLSPLFTCDAFVEHTQTMCRIAKRKSAVWQIRNIQNNSFKGCTWRVTCNCVQFAPTFRNRRRLGSRSVKFRFTRLCVANNGNMKRRQHLLFQFDSPRGGK